MKLRSTFLIFTLAFPASLVLGHDDVIGTRFVAASGHDTGNCDDNHHPCRTLEYALSRVNPGDAVKLAAGTYDLSSVDIERLLIGKEGVRGGYSAEDHFRIQNSEPTSRVSPACPTSSATTSSRTASPSSTPTGTRCLA